MRTAESWLQVVQCWLDDFAEAVRTEDVARGRDLFDADVLAFGTRTVAMEGLDQLEQDQWRAVWAATRDFAFHDSTIMGRGLGVDGSAVVVVASRWSSSTKRDDPPRPRSGRVTLVLTEAAPGTGELRCVHSHFSIDPGEWRGAG